MNTHQRIFIGLYILSALVFSAHFLYVGSGVWGDGRYYYSYLRSAVIDHDLRFENEFKYFKIPLQISQTGYAINKFSLGPALFWLPFFITAHLLTLILHGLGLVILHDGYTWPYQIAVGLGSVGYAVVGLYLCYLSFSRILKKNIALMSSVAIFLASNLFFYGAIDPINSHSVSFFSSSLLFYIIISYWNKKTIDIRGIFGLGITTGLIALIRNQDVIWGVMGILIIARWLDGSMVKKIINLLIYILSTLIVLIPQFWVWKMMFGQITSPYLLLGEKFYWLQPQLFSVLFSANHGLFIYSPILLLSVWGLHLIKDKMKWIAIIGVILFLLQTWIVGAWHSWWAGESYGNRMFISLMPIFILGFGYLLKQYGINRKTYLLLSCLILINMGTIVWYLLGR